MTDPTKTPAEAPHFDTSDVEANRAIEQGLGVGARELAAQRESGGVVTPDDDDDSADGAAVNTGDGDALNQTVGRGAATDEG